MAADLFNLRIARKRQRRGAAERQAEASRIRHGMPKALRREADTERARESRLLDGAKRDPSAPVKGESPTPPDQSPGKTGKPS